MWNKMAFARALADYIFPPRCFLCKQEGISLCIPCIKTLGRAVDSPAPHVLSIFDFHDTRVKKIIHAIKYYRRKDLVAPLASYTSSHLITWTNNEGTSILVPIPMPAWRKYMRGYNQAEVLAQDLSRATGFPVARLLSRTKSTPRQASITKRGERLKAQKSSFKAATDVKGKHVILVDDVTTTGATLNEARVTLFAHGAKSVRAITLAH